MELRQSIILKGTRTVRVMPDETLSVAIRSDGAVSEYSVPLRALDESPVRTKQPASKFVLGVVVCAFLFVGFLLAQFFATAPEIRILLGVLAFLDLLPLGFSIYRLWRLTYDVTEFYYRSSGQAAFNLFTDRPTPETFQEFVRALIKQIKAAQLHSGEENSDSIASQIKSFAKLREQGILTEEEFQNIKTRLLVSVTSPRGPIGFTM